jgi:hypothetical protein
MTIARGPRPQSPEGTAQSVMGLTVSSVWIELSLMTRYALLA